MAPRDAAQMSAPNMTNKSPGIVAASASIRKFSDASEAGNSLVNK